MYIIRKIKKFYNNFKRSSKWFIRMWKNYDWDDWFLIKLMVDKMKDMRYQLDVVDKDFVDLRHQPNKFHLPDDDNYEIIDCLEGLDKAIMLGDKILRHDYIQYTPEVQEWFDTHDFLEDKQPEHIRKQLDIIYKKAEEEEQNDRKMFFDIIRDEHQKWWS